MIRRRQFFTLLGGAAAGWPFAARAQQGDRVRRIAVLMLGDENDPVWKPGVSAFTQALAGLGWTDGRNVRMDLRWHGGDTNRLRALAQELVGLHRFCKSEPGEDAIRIERSRHLGTSRLRAAEYDDRDQYHAHTLSRRRPGDAGFDRGPDRLPVPSG